MLAQQPDHTNLARHASDTTATRTPELMLAQPAGHAGDTTAAEPVLTQLACHTNQTRPAGSTTESLVGGDR
jgi:hypothetical protein